MTKQTSAAAQLANELAALPHQTGASKTLARDPERITSGKIGGAANAIVGVLFPGREAPPEWWRTPLGLWCAADPTLGVRTLRIKQVTAAGILGIAPGSVAVMCQRKTLDCTRDGVLMGPVLDRLVERGVA